MRRIVDTQLADVGTMREPLLEGIRAKISVAKLRRRGGAGL
jgi:hypothetical protein